MCFTRDADQILLQDDIEPGDYITNNVGPSFTHPLDATEETLPGLGASASIGKYLIMH